MVICLERGADLHMAQLIPLPLTTSCCSKIQIGFTCLVPANLGSPEQKALKRVCVCVIREVIFIISCSVSAFLIAIISSFRLFVDCAGYSLRLCSL